MSGDGRLSEPGEEFVAAMRAVNEALARGESVRSVEEKMGEAAKAIDRYPRRRSVGERLLDSLKRLEWYLRPVSAARKQAEQDHQLLQTAKWVAVTTDNKELATAIEQGRFDEIDWEMIARFQEVDWEVIAKFSRASPP